jgi:phospholipid-binding lipoprotein MlaA
LKKILLLLVIASLVVSPLHAADMTVTEVPTQVIPAGQQDDQFDEDFADDFVSNYTGKVVADKILIDDPLEGLNRGIFWVNDKLYFYLMKPIARGYRFVVPRQARISVGHFFSNLGSPVRAANALLQFKFNVFFGEIYRFIVNTTIGVGGLFDPAATFGRVEKVEEDFGQTLGYFGAGHGFYLMLPIIGPSSFRDATGSVVDSFADPIRYADIKDLEYLGIKSFSVLNSLSLDRDTYEGIVRDSLDPYLFVRAAYAQRRAAQVGKTDYDILSIEGTFLDDESLNPFKWLGL